MTQASRAGWDGILQDGETILWQGQPVPGIRWRDLLSAQSAFGVVFAGFALFWITAAAAMTAGSGAPGVFAFFPLFGLPFLAVGLYMVGGQAVIDAMRRGKTWYTLTDRTAFVASEFLGRKSLDSYPLAKMPFVRLIDDDPGSIEFGDMIPVRRNTRSAGGRGQSLGAVGAAPGFHRIGDARKVYAQMRRARAARTDGQAS
jgi:hypothetical protein